MKQKTIAHLRSYLSDLNDTWYDCPYQDEKEELGQEIDSVIAVIKWLEEVNLEIYKNL